MTRYALILVAILTACGPSVFPDTDARIIALRRLHAQFRSATKAPMLTIQSDALRVSEGIDEARLPADLRPWIHDLRTYGLAFLH